MTSELKQSSSRKKKRDPNILSITFMCHPLGFGVLPVGDHPDGDAAAVSSIQNEDLKKLGLEEGMLIHSCTTKESSVAKQSLLGLDHDQITQILKALTFPCTLRFQKRSSKKKSSWSGSDDAPRHRGRVAPNSVPRRQSKAQRPLIDENKDEEGGGGFFFEPFDEDLHLVKLNVCGKRFVTKHTTLTTGLDPQSYFPMLLSNKANLPVDKHGYIFLDRNPEYFAAILDILQQRDWFCPKTLDADRLRKELRHYQLDQFIKNFPAEEESVDPLDDEKVSELMQRRPLQGGLVQWADMHRRALSTLENSVFKSFRRRIKANVDEVCCRFLPSLDLIKLQSKIDSKLQSWEASVLQDLVAQEHQRQIEEKAKMIQDRKHGPRANQGWGLRRFERERPSQETLIEAKRMVSKEFNADMFLKSLNRPLISLQDPPGDVFDDEIYILVKELLLDRLNVEQYFKHKHNLSVQFEGDARLIFQKLGPQTAGWQLTQGSGHMQDGQIEAYTITWSRRPITLA